MARAKHLEFPFDPRFPFRDDPHNGEGQFVAVENEHGKIILVYDPWPHQLAFHSCEAPNVLALGTRGTGKSVMIRNDAYMRCLAIPQFQALVLRRTMPELRESHLKFVEREVKLLGGTWLKTTSEAHFPNGSRIVFRHCETEADILNFLSAEYGAIYFDELSTFTLNQFLQISAAARAPEGAGYTAIVRAGSNPLGSGAEWMEQWFVSKTVRLEDFPDYNPDDFVMQFSTMEDNPSIDSTAYAKRLRNLPDHVRRAWLMGEFVVEGAYFKDFRPTKMMDIGNPESIVEWHVLEDMPLIRAQNDYGQLTDYPIDRVPWVSIYRALDWGYDPDPAVCLWIAVLPDRRAIVIKEKKWERTLAKTVAEDIRRLSEGMHVVDTFADPSIFLKDGQSAFSIADIFEQNGVPLTASINDRQKFGYAVHDHLNTLVDGRPLLRIVRRAAPDLIRTFPTIRTDKLDPTKIADGEDHWVIALAYFCMGLAMPAKEPTVEELPQWMRPKRKRRLVVG